MDFSQYERPTAEWQAYLAKNPKLLVDGGIPTQSLSAFRNSSNLGRAKWSAGQIEVQNLTDKFITGDHQIAGRDGISMRLRQYTPLSPAPAQGYPAFIHLHGGGYLNGSIETETSICAAIAVALNIVVLHPEYRHTDTSVFPTMFDDVWDAYDWILDNSQMLCIDSARVVIGGQSAGSGLAASTVQQDIARSGEGKRQCRVRGQILTIPWLMHPRAFPYDRFVDRQKTSPVQCADKPGLSTAKLEWFASLLHAADVLDTRLNPGLQQGKELEGTPPTALLIAGGDPLRDQGLAYGRSLEQSRSALNLTYHDLCSKWNCSIPTRVHIFPAVPHTFRSCDGLPSAAVFVERLIQSISWALGDDVRGNQWAIENVGP